MSEGDVTEKSDPQAFAAVLEEAVAVAEKHEIPHAVFGSIAASYWGRPTASGDIDLFVREHEAERLHELLAKAGFETEVENEKWLLKAVKQGVLVDLIFKVRGDIYFDQEMHDRRVAIEYLGKPVHVLSPEDTLLVEALSNEFETADHWFNGLAVLGKNGDLDWDYLLRRARLGAHRMLAMLVYAQSTDIPVPDAVIHALYDLTYGGRTPEVASA